MKLKTYVSCREKFDFADKNSDGVSLPTNNKNCSQTNNSCSSTRIAPKLTRIAPKLTRIAPKLSIIVSADGGYGGAVHDSGERGFILHHDTDTGHSE